MLSDLESIFALVEKQDIEVIDKTKDRWQYALNEAQKILPEDNQLIVEYNPAIWRISRHLVGLRLFSYPWTDVFIFEFATPNSVFSFDCFESEEAKIGVMVHEIAHFVDDRHFTYDLRSLVKESKEFVTREQRAELLAYIGYPQGIYEANKSLITATLTKSGFTSAQFEKHLDCLAAIETLGRIGMDRSDDLPTLYKYLEENDVPVHEIFEEYLSTSTFALAGLTTSPDLNGSSQYGIKRYKDLSFANYWLCKYLKGKIELASLGKVLNGFNYKIKSDFYYNPLRCVDFNCLDLKIARNNIDNFMKFLDDHSEWACFRDLQEALKKIIILFEKNNDKNQ